MLNASTCLLLSCLVGAHALSPLPYDAKIDAGKQGSYPVLPKFSSSKARAPYVNFRVWNPECDDGLYYFVTPRGWKVSDPGPMILDPAGQLIWTEHFTNEYGGQAYDFKVQQYRGVEYLTFWLGDDTVRGHGAGHYYMLNASYDIVRKIGAANSLRADLHDLVITPEGTGLLTIFNAIGADVTAQGRKFHDIWNQAMWDCLIQEVDIETGDLIFEWRASEHVNMSATYSKLPSTGDAGTRTNPFDWFHINSVEKDELGNYLVSARNVHAIYYVDGKTKQVVWTLGGRQNLFQDLSGGSALAFAWQHDARFVPIEAFPMSYVPPPKRDGTITRLMTLFDNAAMDWDYTYGMPYSRGLLLEVTYPASGSKVNSKFVGQNLGKIISQGETANAALSVQDLEKVQNINGTDPAYTVRVVQEYVHPQHVRSGTQGNLQRLSSLHGSNPNVILGYGINAVVTKFSGNGTVLCDLHFGAMTSWFGGDVQSYRAFKFPWTGRPSSPPTAVLHWGKVYVSWNGGTEVAGWELQASDANPPTWQKLKREAKRGFETVMLFDAASQQKQPKYLRVLAFDKDGHFIPNGNSNIVELGFIDTIVTPHVPTESEHLVIVVTLLLLGNLVALWMVRRLWRRCFTKRAHKVQYSLLSASHTD